MTYLMSLKYLEKKKRPSKCILLYSKLKNPLKTEENMPTCIGSSFSDINRGMCVWGGGAGGK